MILFASDEEVTSFAMLLLLVIASCFQLMKMNACVIGSPLMRGIHLAVVSLI